MIIGSALKGIPLPDSKNIYKLISEHRQQYSEHFLTERARSDAAHNLPDPESPEPSPFENQVLHETSILASKVAVQYKRALEMLDAAIKSEESVTQQHSSFQQEQIKQNGQEFTEDVDGSFSFKDAYRQLTVAEERFNKFYDQYGRPPVVYIRHWFYVFFAMMIFAGEIPLNALVFQIFGENQIMTWVMAVIIGLAVPLTAHFAGIKLREHPHGIHWGNLVKAAVSLSVITTALYGLSVMRRTYLGENKEALGLTDNLVQSSIMFFWLNLAVLGAAVMIAYLSHDPVPGYQQADKELKRARKAAGKLDKWYRKERLSLRHAKRNMIKVSETDSLDATRKIHMLKGYYDLVLKEGQELENQCLNGLMHDIEIYRRENLQARSDKRRPKSFNTCHVFELRLRNMKEKLEN